MKADRPGSLARLARVRDDLPSFYFSGKSYLLMALNRHKLGQDKEARRIASELKRSSRTSASSSRQQGLPSPRTLWPFEATLVSDDEGLGRVPGIRVESWRQRLH